MAWQDDRGFSLPMPVTIMAPRDGGQDIVDNDADLERRAAGAECPRAQAWDT